MLKPYEEYKKIDLLWLDIIPSHWQCMRNKNILTEINVRSLDGSEELLRISQYTGVTIRRHNKSKVGMRDAETLEGYKIVKKNDIVMNIMLAWNGSTGASAFDGIVSPAYSVFRVKQDVNPWYIHYLFRIPAVTNYFKAYSTGVIESRLRLYPEKLFMLTSIIPPREEQDQIVRFLDWKLAKINKLIRAKKKQIELLNEQKQVIINNAVTKGLDPNVPMKDSGIEWIGTIPEHWKVLYLSQTATEQSISNKDIHNQNLLSLSYGKIINKDINTTDGLLPASFDTYQIVHNGNIILRLTDLQNDHKSLRVGLATQTGIITSAYTCLLPRENVIPEFLYLLLHSYDICKVFYGMGGGVRQSIGFDDIRRLLIPVPPLEEQRQIVDFCYAKSNFIEGFLVGIEKEILLLTEYRTRLISDVVTGKVDVRGIEIPEYEAVPDDVTEDELDGENAMDDEAEEAEVE